MRKAIILALAALCAATSARATSVKDFWQTRPTDAPRFHSTKSSLALEMCIGLEMSEKGGPPFILHGERETLLTVVAGIYNNAPIYGARILDHDTSREIIVGAVQTGGSTNRATAMVRGCL